MKILHKASAIIVVLLLVVAGCDQPTNLQNDNTSEIDQTTTAEVIPGQYIVVFNDNTTKDLSKSQRAQAVGSQIQSMATEYQISNDALKNRYQYSVSGFTAELTDDQLQSLRNDSRVDYIEQDRFVTLAPPGACSPWPSCRNNDDGGDSGQTTPWGVTRVGGPVSSSGVAWVIDTGIDLDHPDLNVDTQRSAVFLSSGSGSDTPDDGNGHGSHVAGTIAALDNDIDVVGVAAGATVVAVKVLDDRGSGSYSGVIDGIDYVAANAAAGDVANMSLGGGTSDAVDDAVRNAADQGIYFAIAAGNDGDDANNYSPARVEYNNVWTVSATDDTDTFASFSNFSGPTDPPIEFAAPGVDVLSTWKDGGTNTISGTSMASPHVAGVLLLTGGNPSSDGTANSDPDGDPDPIVHN